MPGSPGPGGVKPDEDKNSPDNRKKKALEVGPVLDMQADKANDYQMDESLFTSLRDIFEAVIKSQSRIGVVAPHRFLEILRRENEMFRSAMHQDAHEFLNLLLNQVVDNVELFAKQHPQIASAPHMNGNAPEVKDLALTKTQSTAATAPTLDTRWVHDLFEGQLTSETRCLTCENTSQRDEAFLDLSVDLEAHSSVTSCLRKFSEEEMLCERNKFHCDNCGGLQEAEKRMKIRRLPRILALHLKRFKYTEDMQRLQKLFHRVVYPFYLRLFTTTDDAEDPDRLYELYSVVVHIGGGPYHGHYVTIVKTEDRGWLLFDDELVEPVSKEYVQQFFGGEPVPGVQDAKQLACAYVLFYQETTMEKMLKEQEMESQSAAAPAASRVSEAHESRDSLSSPTKTMNGNGLVHAYTNVQTPIAEEPPYAQMAPLRHASTTPNFEHALLGDRIPPVPVLPTKSKKELKAEEKERKAAEKIALKEKEAEYREASRKRMEAYKQTEENLKRALEESKATAAAEAESRGQENGEAVNGKDEKRKSGFSRFARGSVSLRIGKKDKDKLNGSAPPVPQQPASNGATIPRTGTPAPAKESAASNGAAIPRTGTPAQNAPTNGSHEDHPGDHKTHQVVTGENYLYERLPPPVQPVHNDEKKEKKNRFSLGRKKSSLLP